MGKCLNADTSELYSYLLNNNDNLREVLNDQSSFDDIEFERHICKKICLKPSIEPSPARKRKCFALFDKINHNWKKALVECSEKIPTEQVKSYQVQFNEQNSHTTSVLDQTCVSLCNEYYIELKLGLRIIRLKNMTSATVAELPSKLNSNRCLVFYDNGLVEYIKLTDKIHLIADSSTLSRDYLDSDHIEFLNNYFNRYPERDLARLKPNQHLLVYINQKWRDSKVVRIDASLVELESENSIYSIYRGSYCLWPLYEKLIKNLSSSSLSNSFELYILNRKSQANKYLNSSASTQFPNDNISDSNAYIQHTCNYACIFKFELNQTDLRDKNLLEIPKSFGWKRCIFTCGDETREKNIKYMTPCGKMMRNLKELNRYLLKTSSNLSIDMFTFDSRINTKYELNYNPSFLVSADITNGEEFKPISCVNLVDKSDPFCFEYTQRRVPLKGVPLDLSLSLDCCSCLDDCSDLTKCKCLQNTKSKGYKYKRLLNTVPYGIYECNSNCKCNQNKCSNRVVQNGIKLRLQVFRTFNKGWGVRCLDDIAAGSFVSTYSGDLITEQEAKLRESKTGNEYFAELASDASEQVFIVDPKLRGNIGRFFNHSCAPNMFVQSVYVDSHDRRFPWTAFFATDFISAGTELCWDYNYTHETSQRKIKIICKCNSLSCRKRLV